jgi:hypothetical protein
MVEVIVEETVSCTAQAFLALVMDPRRYAEIDHKLGPIDWVRRHGDVTEFLFRSALPGLPGPGPKIVSRMTLTPGVRVDVQLPDLPENRLARRVSTFSASFSCVPVPGGIRVTRTIACGFKGPVRWLVEPILRRTLPADVREEVRGAKRLLER